MASLAVQPLCDRPNSYIWHGTSDPSRLKPKRQTGPLQADYQAQLMAPAVSVFDVVTNHERYAQLIPDLKQVGVRQSEQGLIRQCDFGNDIIIEEQIVLWQPPTAYAYAAIAPNPFGLRHHYAFVTCQPYQDGTHLRWQHYFEHDDLEAMLLLLNRIFDEVFAQLVEQFEGRTLR